VKRIWRILKSLLRCWADIYKAKTSGEVDDALFGLIRRGSDE